MQTHESKGKYLTLLMEYEVYQIEDDMEPVERKAVLIGIGIKTAVPYREEIEALSEREAFLIYLRSVIDKEIEEEKRLVRERNKDASPMLGGNLKKMTGGDGE